MALLTNKHKAWSDTFPEVTRTQYLVMAFLLSWQEHGGVNTVEIGMRVLERPYIKAGAYALSILRALSRKGYAERVPRVHPQQKSQKWRLTLHGCLYLKNYAMPL